MPDGKIFTLGVIQNVINSKQISLFFLIAVAGYLDGYLDLKLGLVQSAYANGSSMEYTNKTWGGFSPQRKFLHHKVSEFDVGMFRSERTRNSRFK